MFGKKKLEEVKIDKKENEKENESPE